MSLRERLHRYSRPRFWRRVGAWRRRIAASERWSPDEAAEREWAQARRVLAHAYDRIPFYREWLRASGVEPGDVRDRADWAQLPRLAKSDLQEHGERMLDPTVAAGARAYATTGGSTGTPVGFWYDVPGSVAAETAFIHCAWARVGYRTGDRTAVLRGLPVEGGGWWADVREENQLRLSSYDLTEPVLPLMVDRLRSFAPRFLQAYPSSAELVASHMLDTGMRPIDGLRAVLCGSETLFGWQRERIEAAFGCRVFSWYGQSERVVFAAECEHETALNVSPLYGLCELLDEDGAPIEEPGRPGEITGTGFTTSVMPLLRYRTGDLATYAAAPCPHCGQGRHRRLARVDGRVQEFIYSATGRPISMTSINMHTAIFDNVRQFRFVQRELGRITLDVVPKKSWYAERDEARIRAELAPKLRDIELEAIVVVDAIAPTASGKQRFLDQHLEKGRR